MDSGMLSCAKTTDYGADPLYSSATERAFLVAGAPMGAFAGSRCSAWSMSSVLSTPIVSKFASSHSLASLRPRSRNCWRKGQETSYLVAALKDSSVPAPPIRCSRSSPIFVALEQAPADEAGDEVGGAQFREQAGVEGDLVHPVGDLGGQAGRLGRARSD